MPHVFDIKKRDKLWGEERRLRQPIGRLMDVLKPEAGEHWLDIGAGNGYVTVPLLEKGCHVTAIDREEVMIFDLISRVPEGSLDRLSTAIGEAPPIPVKDDSADAALLVNTLHELSEKAGLVEELRRTLRKGGRVHIVEHRKNHEENGPPKADRLEPDEIGSLFADFTMESLDEMGIYYHILFRR